MTGSKRDDKSERVALLGGGPSSILPFVATWSFTNVSYYGSPWDSLVLRGRDPQKTVLKLLEVATKYGTQAQMINAALEYYQYIESVRRAFSFNLSKVVGKIHKKLPQANVKDNSGDSLIVHLKTGKLIVAKQEGKGKFFLKNHSETDMERPISYYELDNFCVELNENLTVLDQEGLPVKLEAGHHSFKYPPLIGGELHYLGLLSSVWKPPKDFDETKYSFIINRAGFRYPDDATRHLLAGLNVDFCKTALDFLNDATVELNELQTNLLLLLTEFIDRNDQGRSLLSNTDGFIITGSGRAAGEVSRRLANDVLHATKPGDLSATFSRLTGLESRTEQEYELNLIQKLNERRKAVVTIDHKGGRLDLSSAEAIETIVRDESYEKYLMELTKFGSVPTLHPDDLVHYEHIFQALKTTIPTLTMKGGKLLHSLDLLIKQENPDPLLLMVPTKSRLSREWPGSVWESFSKHFSNCESTARLKQEICQDQVSTGSPTIMMVGLGGSVQAGPCQFKYELDRINASHYRKENFQFLSFLCGSKTGHVKSFEESFVNHVVQNSETDSNQTDKVSKASLLKDTCVHYSSI